jgi:hypothetical protein
MVLLRCCRIAHFRFRRHSGRKPDLGWLDPIAIDPQRASGTCLSSFEGMT